MRKRAERLKVPKGGRHFSHSRHLCLKSAELWTRDSVCLAGEDGHVGHVLSWTQTVDMKTTKTVENLNPEAVVSIFPHVPERCG